MLLLDSCATPTPADLPSLPSKHGYALVPGNTNSGEGLSMSTSKNSCSWVSATRPDLHGLGPRSELPGQASFSTPVPGVQLPALAPQADESQVVMEKYRHRWRIGASFCKLSTVQGLQREEACSVASHNRLVRPCDGKCELLPLERRNTLPCYVMPVKVR